MKPRKAQLNMLKQQIRTWNVLDENILALFARVPQEPFLPAALRPLAYADTALPLGHGLILPPPKEIARLLQALRIQPTDKILQIGTGNGYITALLAGLGRHVYSVGSHPEATQAAHSALSQLNITNITLATGEALAGWPVAAPYDVIVLTASVPQPPKELQRDLAIGGRLFAVIGYAPVMEATLFEQLAADQWRIEPLFETVWPRLPGIQERKPFVF